MKQTDQHRARIIAELESAGAVVEPIRGLCVKVYGLLGDEVMTHDILELTRQELHRLTAGAMPHPADPRS